MARLNGKNVYFSPRVSTFVWVQNIIDVAYSANVEIPANDVYNIAELSGDIAIDLKAGEAGKANEWDIVITQGDTAHAVTFATPVNWGLGIAPTFAANTSTMIRLYYIADKLCGEWSSVAV